jgi:hypothetical protein
MSGFRTAIGGTATVHCVHDRVKRELTDPDEFRILFRAAYKRAPNVVLLCGCCGNLFESLNDTPVNCKTCSGSTVHTLEAPVSAPIEGAM